MATSMKYNTYAAISTSVLRRSTMSSLETGREYCHKNMGQY